MVDCIFFFWCWWGCRWREELILSAAPPGASWRRWKLWQLVPYLYYTWTPISHRAITTTKSAPDRWDSSTSQLFNHHTRSSRSTNIIELINPRQKFSKIVSFLTRAKSEISKKNSYLWNMIDAIYKNPAEVNFQLENVHQLFASQIENSHLLFRSCYFRPAGIFFRNPETEISEIQKAKTNLTTRDLNLSKLDF